MEEFADMRQRRWTADFFAKLVVVNRRFCIEPQSVFWLKKLRQPSSNRFLGKFHKFIFIQGPAAEQSRDRREQKTTLKEVVERFCRNR
jgi:hypothetical protein